MILIFHYVRARDRTCVPLTPFFRLRDARLSARQDARGSRYLRLHAHLPRYFSNTTSLAHARAACASVASSTCPHMCRETAFSRVRSLRSIFSRAPCGHRYPHLQGQLERVRSAPPAAHSARAIDPRMRLSMLFYAAVRTDHSRQRVRHFCCVCRQPTIFGFMNISGSSCARWRRVLGLQKVACASDFTISCLIGVCWGRQNRHNSHRGTSVRHASGPFKSCHA